MSTPTTPRAAAGPRPVPAPPGGGRLLSRRARIALVSALSVVVGMAFTVSWTALKDVATAIGIPDFAAIAYPFVVDGLMALALVATLVLDGPARKVALRVLAAYTAASLTLNYVHGLVPELHDVATGDTVRLAGVDWAHWALVGLAAALPVGAIYYGSDLVARVLHHRPESAPTEDARSGADLRESTSTGTDRSAPAPALGAAPVAPTTAPTPAVESAPTAEESARPVDPDPAEQSTPTETTSRPRPKRTPTARPKTGPVPTPAKQSAPTRRTFAELLAEARALPESDRESAERIRTALRVGANRAREIRDRLAADRDQEQPTAPAPVVPLRSVPAPAAEEPVIGGLDPVHPEFAAGGVR